MKRVSKTIILTALALAVFVYGFSVGFFKIFPYPYLATAKHYLLDSDNSSSTGKGDVGPNSVEVRETFLQRLLIKRIPIPEFTYGGGGVAGSEDILFVVTNKGVVVVFDLKDYRRFENDIAPVPMNLDALNKSMHPHKNEFRLHWYRVNGVYSEDLPNGGHRLFVSHNGYDPEKDCITHNISRTNVILNNGIVAQQGEWDTIFTAVPCIDPVPESIQAAVPYPGHISGGVMANFDENRLLVGIGDYNRHGIDGIEEWATDLSNPYGKFILLDKSSGEWTIYATGNRNATGIHIDREAVIWAVENGPAGGDELNVLVTGENYGWPNESYGIWYDPAFRLPGEGEYGSHGQYRTPVMSWIPATAPRGLIKIEGQKFPLWKGDLIMGTMRDQSLRRLRLDQENRVVYDERIDLGSRVRDLITLADGKLALVTDDEHLLIIDDGGPVFEDLNSTIDERIELLERFDGFLPRTAMIGSQQKERTPKAVYDQYCAVCHNLSPVNGIGPHLHDLLDRKIGGVDGFNYSQTLKAETRTWDAKLLESYLQDPQKEFSGTQMPNLGLPDNDIDLLIQYFREQIDANNINAVP